MDWFPIIEEGSIQDDFSGRYWDVAVRTNSEERQLKEARKEDKKLDQASQDRQKIQDYLERNPAGDTQSGLVAGTKISKRRMGGLLMSMTTEGIIVAAEVEKSAGVTGIKKHPGFKLATLIASCESENCESVNKGGVEEEGVENEGVENKSVEKKKEPKAGKDGRSPS